MRVDKGLSKERIRMSLASSRSPGDRSLGQHRNPVRVAAGSTRSIGCKVSLVFLCLLGFFVLLHSLLPLRTTIQIGADEGFELAKITLSLKGYKFYIVDKWRTGSSLKEAVDLAADDAYDEYPTEFDSVTKKRIDWKKGLRITGYKDLPFYGYNRQM